MTRQPFLRFFALLLAIVAGLVLAWLNGVPQAVWRADASFMTSAIAALMLVAALDLTNAQLMPRSETPRGNE